MWRPRACAGGSAAVSNPFLLIPKGRNPPPLLGDNTDRLVSVGLVPGMIPTIVTAVAMFAATNIDDAVILVVLTIASRGGGTPKRWEIWAGQSLGFAVILVVSSTAALGLRVVPVEWVGLLGLIPL